jgi:hypothetical protein
MDKKIMSLFSVLAIGTFGFTTVAAAEKAVGMPNPMVSYDSVADAKIAAGFQPLYLPSISGYHVNKVWVIAGDIIDIEYVSDNQPVGKFRLRTARCTELRNDDISGIYGAKWRQEKIKGIETSITEVYGMNKKLTGYAAHWTHNNMLFSVSGENMTYREFGRLLSNGLLELSVNYF